MKKNFCRVICFVLLVVMVFALTGCTSSVSYTFTVVDGEKVKVTCDTSDKYSVRVSGSDFYVKDPNGTEVLKGEFMMDFYYDTVMVSLSDTIIGAQYDVKEKTNKDNMDYVYILGDIDGEADVMVMQKVTGTTSVIRMINLVRGDVNSFDNAFSKLSFKVEK